MKNHSIKDQNMPSYLGIYNALYSDIVNGVYLPGERLPGETTLSEKYGVSRNTLRQALAILNEDGMIHKSQGKGTIVCERPERKKESTIANPLIEMCKVPITHEEISFNYGCPTDIARDMLELSSSDIVLACNCIYHSADHITGYSFTQIPSQYFDQLGLDVSNNDSIKDVIENVLFHFTNNLNLCTKLIYANEMEIEFLHIPLDTPILLIEAMHYDNNGNPCARNKFYFIPEYYHIEYTL